MLRPLLGCFLAAVAMFVWGFVFWGLKPLDPFAHTTLAQEQAVAEALADQLPEAGVYFLPDIGTGTEAEWVARHEAGPLAMIAFRPGGADPQAPAKMLMGFFHMLVVAALLGLVIWYANLGSYGGRFSLAALVGVAATIFPNISQPIWFDLPWRYFLTVSVYDLVAWLLAGAVLAYFVRPKES